MSINIDSPVNNNSRKLEEGQKWVFLATFVNYAMAHWTRKSYTNGNYNKLVVTLTYSYSLFNQLKYN